MKTPAHRSVRVRAGLALVCLVLPLFASPTAAEEVAAEPREWTPAFSMEYSQLASTAVSPDGSLVAYVVREPVMDEETSEYRSQIWLAASDGSFDRQYTYGDDSSTEPRFSPDGTYLGFLAKRGSENVQLQLLPVRGGEARALTAVESDVTDFRFLPDSSAVLFAMIDPRSEEDKAKEKGKADVILVNQDHRFAHLHRVPLAPVDDPADAVERLTEGAFHVTAFDVSPDGQRVVLAHQKDPRINSSIYSDLSILDLGTDGAAPVPLVTRDGQEASPQFSPDGSLIAFTSHSGAVERVGLADLWVISPTGEGLRQLAESPDRNAQVVGFTGDSKGVVISESSRTTRQLYVAPTDGSAVRALSDVAGVISAPAISSDGSTLAFAFETTDTAEEIFAAELSAAELSKRQLSHVNDAIEAPSLGATELLTWRSKDDLYDIDGLLTLPVDYRPGDRVPLVLNVHGGPSGVFSQGFTGAPSIYMLQTFAQKGYAVLRPNPRGSTGYGKEFRYSNIRDWGFGDYEDLMAGVDAVIERGVADPDQLYLMGWSYGGYMTSWIITATDRFRAASMGAGLPNLVSMVYTTDIPDYLVAHLGDKELWEDYAEYERHSAMYRVKNVVTPTQVIHGANDLRVPFTQGQELFVALERLGVPTEMVVYPRTPHGPREPKFLMDVTDRILTWFEKHAPAGSKVTESSTGAGR